MPANDNRLELLDQAFFDSHHAASQHEVMQVVYIYADGIDLDAVRRFHHHLSRGLMGRLIERSPLPFGRHRWVLDPHPPDIDVAERPRARSEVGDWADERSQLPIDPESGPGWRLSVLEMTDGSAAVSLVISHYVLDGIGAVIAVIEAILGLARDLGYPLPRSRTTPQAVAEDAAQTVRDMPALARAVISGAREGWRRRKDDSRTARKRLPAEPSGRRDFIVLPAVTMWVDADAWNARAAELGGTGNTLAAGFTAKLAERMGRPLGGDGTLAVEVIVNRRSENDTRAVAVSFARARIDPAVVTTDLSAARASIKKALTDLEGAPDQSAQMAPLAPFTPQRAWKRLVDWALEDPDQPVVCSNLGDVGEVVTRVDGTQPAYIYARGTIQGVTRQWLERIGGHLRVLIFSAPALNKICIHMLAYQPGVLTTKDELRALASSTLAEFGLTATVD